MVGAQLRRAHAVGGLAGEIVGRTVALPLRAAQAAAAIEVAQQALGRVGIAASGARAQLGEAVLQRRVGRGQQAAFGG
ncbi:hypothetical protein [Lysobacter gummosus]|uniref:hypothetical protein n=1 Tax=Lysobacter gummosus TaxID=262324 RepID=UPI003631CB9C